MSSSEPIDFADLRAGLDAIADEHDADYRASIAEAILASVKDWEKSPAATTFFLRLGYIAERWSDPADNLFLARAALAEMEAATSYALAQRRVVSNWQARGAEVRRQKLSALQQKILNAERVLTHEGGVSPSNQAIATFLSNNQRGDHSARDIAKARRKLRDKERLLGRSLGEPK